MNKQKIMNAGDKHKVARHPWKKGEYEALAKTWNPTNYNPREWARLAKKAGMKYEGTLRSSDRNNQGICDACMYAILRSDRQDPNEGGTDAND